MQLKQSWSIPYNCVEARGRVGKIRHTWQELEEHVDEHVQILDVIRFSLGELQKGMQTLQPMTGIC